MHNFIQKKYLNRPFLSVDQIVSKETVYSSALMEDPLFKKNFYNWFEFYDKNKDSMYYYAVNEKWADDVGQCLTKLSSRLNALLEKTLKERTNDELLAMFPVDGIDPDVMKCFFEYARYTFDKKHRNIGARYDFAIMDNGSIFVYEINADTPSMLFESMNLQNLMAVELGNTDAQFNEIYGMAGDHPFVNPGSKTAVIAHDKSGEDFGSTEAIAQLAELGQGSVYLSTIDDLHFDPEEKIRNPFFLRSMPDIDLDNIYVMLPWEEMILSNPDAFRNWRTWADKVRFFEPAWAWFIAHKSFLTLFENGQTIEVPGSSISCSVKSQLAPNGLEYPYISKPVIGRKSSGVTLHKETGNFYSLDNTYRGGPVVFQPYTPSIKVDGATAMGCMWMYGSQAACLSFREFDGDILEIDNERVIMHQLV